jgi:LasA protease
MRHYVKALVVLLIAAVLPAGRAGAADDGRGREGGLVYSYEEMFGFDIEDYLAANAPHLLPHAEVLSHWAGYTTISPRVLLALMELKTRAVSAGATASAEAQERPFGDLSARVGVAEQLHDVADQLATVLYDTGRTAPESGEFGRPPVVSPLHELLGRNAEAGRAVDEFAAVYERLFHDRFVVETQSAQGPSATLGPPTGLLQFPYPRGATWHIGGAHTNTGSGSYPLSSLDMYRGGGWGSNQSNYWVSASAGGTFKRHSSCFAEVVHSGGWSTTYYHLMNIRYSTGATVSQNAAIANPANTYSQAICNGGHSTGPHEHWSLKSNGSWYHLNNNVYLSGYRITATGSSYDTNCNRFYLVKNGQRYCAGWFYNP